MVGHFMPSEIQGKRNARTGIKLDNCRAKGNRFYFSSRQIILTSILLLVFMGSGIGYVWSNYQGTQIGFDLSRLQEDELKLKEVNRRLKVELATLMSPEYLEKAARELGLKEASPDQIKVLP
jgi:cell division protein FtsL